MTMKDELGALDRGTLAVWRGATLLVPMMVALGVAVMLTWFVQRLGPWYMVHGIPEVPGYVRWTLLLSVAIGIESGILLGRYAYARAEAAAATVAAAHVILFGFAGIGLGSSAAYATVSPLWGLDSGTQMIIGSIQVVVAFATAGFVRRRRPLALRGGRPS